MMKTRSLQFVPTPRSHAMRGALSAVWIATGNRRPPLACVWIDRDLRCFAAVEPVSSHAIADASAEDEVPLLRALCA